MIARTTADELPIRPEIRGVGAYGAPQLDVAVRLNTNENPFPPSAAVIESISEMLAGELGGLQRYPDRDAVALRTDLAAYLSSATGVSIDCDGVWAANGSNEILQQILQAFGGPGRIAMGFEPSYSMHSIIARGTGSDFVAIPRDTDFAIDPVTACEAISAMAMTDGALAPLWLPLRETARRSRSTWIQYCAVCLADDSAPYFRRSWRLASRISCFTHRCGLRDRCPACPPCLVPSAVRCGFRSPDHCCWRWPPAAPSPVLPRAGRPVVACHRRRWAW